MPTTTPNQSTLVLLGEEHSGRDEMNLAGNPFALLQAASKAGTSLISYEWERALPGGKIVKASWKVSGDAELGLPGPSEELLYLVLLQVTREVANGNDWPRMVNFARGEVLERLGWASNGVNYRKLVDAFVRLTSVTITAKNSFWNARSKTPYDAISFHLLDDYAIMAEPDGRRNQSALPLSWFRWNETLHESFLAGNVRSLALDFVLTLDGATTRRLFRLLDMMRYATKPPRRDFSIGVMKLRDRLGMTPYAHASKVREKLAPAINNLIERGYLASAEYRKGNDGELVTFTFGSVVMGATTHDEVIRAPKKPVKVLSKPAVELVQPTQDIYPMEAHAVFAALSAADQERLRQMARKDVEPAFWDRLERPDSPMALVLWEIVIREFPDAYAATVDG